MALKHLYFAPPPKNTQFRGNFSTHPHFQKPWRTFKSPPFFIQQSIQRTKQFPLIQLWASSISAVVYVLHREKPSWGSQHMWPLAPSFQPGNSWSRNTFRHSSILPVFSKDYICIFKTIDAVTQIGPPRPAVRGQLDTAPRPGIVLLTPSLTVSSKHSIYFPLTNSFHRLPAFQYISCMIH